MKALVLIDIQQGFDDPKWGARNNLSAGAIAARVLGHWRQRRWPILHVRHDSSDLGSALHPDKAGNQFKEIVQPMAVEPVIGKRVNSAFIGTDHHDELQKAKADKMFSLVSPRRIAFRHRPEWPETSAIRLSWFQMRPRHLHAVLTMAGWFQPKTCISTPWRRCTGSSPP
jgi:hypothetical protein